MLYHQSVHNNLKTKRERKHISNLINFFIFQFFSTFSLLGRVTLSRSSFIQTNIFRKKTLFQHLFILDMSSFFFANFQLPKNIFFWRKRIRHSFFSNFFNLLFKIKHYLTSRKKQSGKLYFFVFFFLRNSKYIFFVLTRVKFFNFTNFSLNTKNIFCFFFVENE